MFGESSANDADAESSVKEVFGNLFKTAKAQNPSTISTNIEDNFKEDAPPPPAE